jgi:hypothetical protein
MSRRIPVAISQGIIMRINWVFAAGYHLDPSLDLERIKSIGPSWGSWQTWRSCGTDNVICHDSVKAKELITRAFQAVCNFYVPKNIYQDLNRPVGIRLYDGDYIEQINNIEDIVGMHLVAEQSDLVLLVGYDFSKPIIPPDRFEEHKIRNRHGLMRSVIASTPECQWVLVDHPAEIDKAYSELSNITCDKMESVLKLLL